MTCYKIMDLGQNIFGNIANKECNPQEQISSRELKELLINIYGTNFYAPEAHIMYLTFSALFLISSGIGGEGRGGFYLIALELGGWGRTG